MPRNRRVFEEWILLFTAAFALVWAVVRACMQSITLDESDTYFWFAGRTANYIWFPFPNNHVLNTLLIWISTHLFGLSAFTVRAPALLGAVLYIAACYFLSRTITDRFLLKWAILICLIFNPYILDFMSAARGYSLANALLLAAIAIPVWHRVHGAPSLNACCALASLALGLSFAANFSFAFADLAAFLAILMWALLRARRASIIAFCIVPGLLVAALLCGYPLTHWPKNELWYGAHSLTEMRQSLLQASFYQPSRRVIGLPLYDQLTALSRWLPPILLALCFAQIVVTRVDGSWLRDGRTRSLGRFGAALASGGVLAILMSWLAFHFRNLPLPLGRTGIYLIPICTLVSGIIAAAPGYSKAARWLGQGISATFLCLACYYLLCLRFTYFKEYEWDADIKDVYSVLAQINHRYGANDVAMDGLYVSPLNFYRVISNRETFPEFRPVPAHQLPTDKSIYVIHQPYEQDFIEQQGLVVIYHGKQTEVAVAVKPGGPVPPVQIDREHFERTSWPLLGWLP